MSLKAKIEAVIYASEEPVTLAQLAGLLGLEAQAELDRAASAQHELHLEVSAEDPAAAGEPDATDEPQSVEPELPPDAGEPAGPADRKVAREERARAQRLRDHFRALVDELIGDYAQGDRGLEIREVAGGYRLATKPEYHDAVRGFVRLLKPPLKLTLQALETLAVVAYKQPVTAPEISEIRGVDSGGVLGSLLARKLITTAGRKQVIGRPILYKTTRDFLLRFGLKDLAELPSIEEFEKMAHEFAESDGDAHATLQEEIVMAPSEVPQHSSERLTTAELEAELDATGSQPNEDASIDTVPVDGRISGPPPRYDAPPLDAELAAEAGDDSGDQTERGTIDAGDKQ